MLITGMPAAETPKTKLVNEHLIRIFGILFCSLRGYLAASLLQQLEHCLFTLYSFSPLRFDFHFRVVYHAFKQLENVLFGFDTLIFLRAYPLSHLVDVVLETGVDFLSPFDSLLRPRFD